MSKKNRPKNKPEVKPKPSSTGDSQTRPGPSRIRRSASRKNFFAEHWKQLSIISILAFSLYIKSTSFDYVLDDSILIVSNKFTQQGIAGIDEIFKYESFKGAFGDQNELVEGGRYRPMSIASFALEKSITGGSPVIAHLINVLLYVLIGIMLYRVLLFMFPRQRSPGKENWFFNVPFITTILFIAHPLHVEVVANVKGRDELFAFIGEAAVMYFTFKYLDDKKRKWLIWSFISFFFGILSKEGVITFLAIIPITAYFFTKSTLTDRIKISLPLIAGTILYLLMRLNAIGFLFSGSEVTSLMNNPFYGMPFGDKMATIFYTLLLYLKLLVYPHPLTHDYYPYHIPIMHWSDWAPILSLVLHLGLVAVMIKGWKSKTIWSYSIAFYLITLSIVSNLLISVGTFMNERFVFHSLLGFCIAAAWFLVEKMNASILLKRLAMAIFIGFAVILCVLTLKREPDWRSITALDEAGLKYSPNSARANHFYGVDIWNKRFMTLPKDADSATKKRILDSVTHYFDRALEILPSYSMANSMKAGVAAEYHKLDNNYEKLIPVFEKVNLTGTYEKFILEYLHYINPRVNNQKDARLLESFYKRMITYYDKIFKNTNLPGEYRSLLREIQQRMNSLP